jgi:hypothetical protein
VVEYGIQVLPAFDFEGRAVAVVVAKASWTVGEDRIPRPSEAPEPVLLADVLVEGDDPRVSPILLESDAALLKQKTDLVIHGTAHAPDQQAAPTFDVSVSLAGQRRTLLVHGPRRAVWQKPSGKKPTAPVFTSPTPIRRVAVDFRNAYGGMARFRIPDTDDVFEVPCPVNPLGKGYCIQNSPEALEGLELPQIEDPETPITPETLVRIPGDMDTLPVAAGFGVYGSAWIPRMAWFGVMPHDVLRVKATIADQIKALDPVKDLAAIEMMRDYDPPILAPEYFQASAPGMAFPLLAGDEPLILGNMSPSGFMGFDLPGRAPILRLDRGDGPMVVPMVLDTVAFLADEGRLLQTWRGRVVLSGPDEFDRLPAMPVDVRDGTPAEARREAAGKPPDPQ